MPISLRRIAALLAAVTMLVLLPALGRAGEPAAGGDRTANGGSAAVAAPSAPDTGSAAGGATDTTEVTKAQEHLKAAGFDPGNTDGVVDQHTERAIRQFQQAKSLPLTGRLDVQTRAALLEVGGLRNPGTDMDRV